MKYVLPKTDIWSNPILGFISESLQSKISTCHGM